MTDEQQVTETVDTDAAVTPEQFAELGLGDAANQAFADGNVRAEIRKLHVTVGGKKIASPFIKVEAVNGKGVNALASGDSATIVKHFNYGLDLERRGTERQKIESRHVDPEVQIEKAAKKLVAAYAALGQTLSESQAKDMARAAMPKA